MFAGFPNQSPSTNYDQWLIQVDLVGEWYASVFHGHKIRSFHIIYKPICLAAIPFTLLMNFLHNRS